MLSEDIKTPVKTVYRLDLATSEHCCALCCEKITDSDYRRKLYKLSTTTDANELEKAEKTDICHEIEDVIGAQFGKLDLKIVCRNCYRQIHNITLKRKEQLEKFKKNQAKVKEQFVITKSKRMSKDGGGHQSTRKKLEVGSSVSEVETQSKRMSKDGGGHQSTRKSLKKKRTELNFVPSVITVYMPSESEITEPGV